MRHSSHTAMKQWLTSGVFLGVRRDISARVALAVILKAEAQGLLHNPKAQKELQSGQDALLKWIRRNMFFPKYTNLVELPIGVME